MFISKKNQYYQDDSIPQNNLQTECNSHQNSNIFIEINNFMLT